MATTELKGLVRNVHIMTCAIIIDGDDGETHNLEFEMGQDAIYYYGWLHRRVKCTLKDGIVTEVVAEEAAAAP